MDGIMSFSHQNFFYILMLLIYLLEQSESLSIELIHPFSPNSPFYDPNITYSEMVERFNSRPRPQAITNWNSTFPGMKVIRPVLKNTMWGFHAKLNLGTFHDKQPPYETHYLDFDTGTDITWLECEDCAKPIGRCFRERELAYPNSMSRTYAPLIYDEHPLCYSTLHIGQHCAYKRHYKDNSYSIGILAYEAFTFDSSHTHPVEALRAMIGCGICNKMTITSGESGVMGMGWGPHSLVNQLYMHSEGRFSYCLPPLASDVVRGRPAILHFGPDTPSIHGLYSLTIHQYDRESAYYVKLQGISINNRRLHIPLEYFAKISSGEGGCVFDTGTPNTYISRQAYQILKEEMKHHMSTVDTSLEVGENRGIYDLCFKHNPPHKGDVHLPTITFHFEEGAHLVIQRDIAFVTWPQTHDKTFCMTILPAIDDNLAVIGTQAQANHVIVYDLRAKKMYFGPQDCAQNP